MRNMIKVMLCSLLLGLSSQLMAQDYTVEVQFPGIHKDRIALSGGREYLVTADTKCYTEEGKPISYESIYNVGHIDRARITLTNGEIKAIHILEIQM